MGHKTHPLGFRLGLTQEHRSSWYAKLKVYAKYIEEDYQIRKIIVKIFHPQKILRDQPLESSGITKILIHRINNDKHINIRVHTAKPGILVGPKGSNLRVMDQDLRKALPSQSTRIYIDEYKKTYEHADLIADTLVDELERRLPFRRVMKACLQAAQEAKVQGIKIQVAGRLNGAEIARTEWLREGRVPLQTLRADIDYSAKTANTTHGILGIKVWLFKGSLSQSQFPASPV